MGIHQPLRHEIVSRRGIPSCLIVGNDAGAASACVYHCAVITGERRWASAVNQSRDSTAFGHAGSTWQAVDAAGKFDGRHDAVR